MSRAALRSVAILGAGPAGLYAATLIRRRFPDVAIRILEQNPEGVTFGFGVVFSDRALEFLAADDPETHDAITRALETWQDITLDHAGARIAIDGVGFAAIGRLRLLRILQGRARALGIDPEYGRAVTDLAELGEADLVIGADGVNSLVRRGGDFGTEREELSNRFAWFGTRRRFDTLTQTFRRMPLGHFNAHHYRYAPDASTFIVEVDAETHCRAGFGAMPEAEARAACEAAFADVLDGEPLISNRSVWRRFPKLRNARWSLCDAGGNRVLVGDALRTAHFSIGSGTRLAMEDVIALVRALGEHPGSIPDALASYEAARRPVVEKLLRAADASAAWYEHFAEHMRLPPWAFALSYIRRSGRIDADRLRRMAPGFMRRLEAEQPALAAS